jgi:hypothetical protein
LEVQPATTQNSPDYALRSISNSSLFAESANRGPGLLNRAFDVFGLALLRAFVIQIPACDGSSHIFFGGTVRQRIDRVCEIDTISVFLVLGFPSEIRDGLPMAGVTSWSSEWPPGYGVLLHLTRLADLGHKCLSLRVHLAVGFDQFYERGKAIFADVLFFSVCKSGQSSEVPPVSGAGIAKEFLT